MLNAGTHLILISLYCIMKLHRYKMPNKHEIMRYNNLCISSEYHYARSICICTNVKWSFIIIHHVQTQWHWHSDNIDDAKQAYWSKDWMDMITIGSTSLSPETVWCHLLFFHIHHGHSRKDPGHWERNPSHTKEQRCKKTMNSIESWLIECLS